MGAAWAVGLWICWAIPFPTQTPEHIDGVYLQLLFEDRESRWFRHHLEVWFTEDRLRMDGFTEEYEDQEEGSLFLLPEPVPTMVEVNHAARQYSSCSVADVVGTERKTGLMDAWPIRAGADGPLLVLETGETETGWDAYMVELRQPGPEEERVPINDREFVIRRINKDVGLLWFSADLGHSRESVADLLYSTLRPYIELGGSGIQFHTMYLRTLIGLRARPLDGLPDLLPVRITAPNLESPGAVSTLQAIRVGPIDPSVFDPPEGYERTESPKCPQ